MADAGDDLDLLMSLDEDGAQVVLETPPSSPPPAGGHGAFTPPRAVPRPGGTDMSVFRDAVKDYIEAVPASISGSGPRRPKLPKSTQTIVDTYSGLRIKNMAVSPVEIADRFADVRFVRISAFQYGFIQLPPLFFSLLELGIWTRELTDLGTGTWPGATPSRAAGRPPAWCWTRARRG
jgi:hypothetical protein